jgi:arylsulfatase A
MKIQMLTTFSFVLAALPASAALEPLPTVDNIVFILADDLGIRDLGCYGSDYYETPHLDRLAAKGMLFTDAYSAHAVCSPTRASILTGRYPHRLHLTAHVPGLNPPTAKLLAPDWIKYLRKSETTYAEVLRDAGFSTFHVGKWHVSSEYAGVNDPALHGFTHVQRGRSLLPKNLEDPHHLMEYTAALTQFIRQHANERFMAVLSMDQPHVPLYEQEECIARFRDKPAGSSGQNNPVMAAMIARMDWSVGEVMALLDELGLSESTAVVFSSDNGGLANATSNYPFRGGKSQKYEGGIRVPLIVKWPGVTQPGLVSNVPVISNDFFPTFLSMAGLPLMPEQHLDGLSLAPILSGQADTLARNTLYWHYPHYHIMPPHSAIRHGDWKLIKNYESGSRELFNLADDPGENTDLSRLYPERVSQLDAWLADHLQVIGAQFPTLNPNYDPSRPWLQNRGGNMPFDPFERNQQEDPRTYVEDPTLDYGKVR